MNPDINDPGHVYLLRDSYFACANSAVVGHGAPMRRPSAFLNLGLRGPFEVEFPGHRRQFRAVLYAPHCARLRVTAAQAGFLTFDLAARSLQYTGRLQRRLAGAEYLELPWSVFAPLEDALAAALAGTLSPAAAAALFEDVYTAALGPADQSEALDPRILIVLNRLRERDPLQPPPRLPELAAAVQLSESRLMHLFTERVGMSIRSYAQWLKVLRLIQLWREDASITELAAEAGFHDAAHFSNLCSRMLGLPPTAYKDQRRFRIHRCF